MNFKTNLVLLALCAITSGSVWVPQAVAAPTAHNEADNFDPYKPGAYLDGKTFHVPAGASFAWQAWENPRQQVGAIAVNELAEQAFVKIELVELARPSEGADSLVLNQYTLTVNPDVPVDTILEVKTAGGADTSSDRNWSFGFVLHIVAADKYMMLFKKLHVI